MCVNCDDGVRELRVRDTIDKLRDRLALYYLADHLGESAEEAGFAFYDEVAALLHISGDGDAAAVIALLMEREAREQADELRAHMVEDLEGVR